MARIANKTISTDTNSVQFDFINGTVIKCRLHELPQEMIERLALHGLSQKCGDSYASANDKGWSVDDCADATRDVIGNLIQGVWSASGERGGNAIIIEALSSVTGKTLEECRTVYGAMSEEQQKELAKHPGVKAEVARIKAERAATRAAGMNGGDNTDLVSMFHKQQAS